MAKVDKAKEKVAVKIAKAKDKIARKCAKACIAALTLTLVTVGCQSVPSRSQTINVTDSTVNVIIRGTDEKATEGSPATVEILTQAMSIENSGTETLSPSQTADVKPDLDVTVGGKATADTLSSLAEDAVEVPTTERDKTKD